MPQGIGSLLARLALQRVSPLLPTAPPLPPQDIGSLLAGLALQGGEPFYAVLGFLMRQGGMDRVLARYPAGSGAPFSLGNSLRAMLDLVLDDGMLGGWADGLQRGGGPGSHSPMIRHKVGTTRGLSPPATPVPHQYNQNGFPWTVSLQTLSMPTRRRAGGLRSEVPGGAWRPVLPPEGEGEAGQLRRVDPGAGLQPVHVAGALAGARQRLSVY